MLLKCSKLASLYYREVRDRKSAQNFHVPISCDTTVIIITMMDGEPNTCLADSKEPQNAVEEREREIIYTFFRHQKGSHQLGEL